MVLDIFYIHIQYKSYLSVSLPSNKLLRLQVVISSKDHL